VEQAGRASGHRRCAKDRRRACSRRRSSPAARKPSTEQQPRASAAHVTACRRCSGTSREGRADVRSSTLRSLLLHAASALSLWLRPLPCPLSSLDSAAESMREVGTRCDSRQNLAAVVPGYRSSLVASAAAQQQQRAAAESERRRDASQQPQQPESRRRSSPSSTTLRNDPRGCSQQEPSRHSTQHQLGAALPFAPPLSRPDAS
jgi:hypothetical protein